MAAESTGETKVPRSFASGAPRRDDAWKHEVGAKCSEKMDSMVKPAGEERSKLKTRRRRDGSSVVGEREKMGNAVDANKAVCEMESLLGGLPILWCNSAVRATGSHLRQ